MLLSRLRYAASLYLVEAPGLNQWSKWKDLVVHVTICRFCRTDDPKVILAGDAVDKHTNVVCREQREVMYGKCVGELLSSAHVLHSSTIVR